MNAQSSSSTQQKNRTGIPTVLSSSRGFAMDTKTRSHRRLYSVTGLTAEKLLFTPNAALNASACAKETESVRKSAGTGRGTYGSSVRRSGGILLSLGTLRLCSGVGLARRRELLADKVGDDADVERASVGEGFYRRLDRGCINKGGKRTYSGQRPGTTLDTGASANITVSKVGSD